MELCIIDKITVMRTWTIFPAVLEVILVLVL